MVCKAIDFCSKVMESVNSVNDYKQDGKLSGTKSYVVKFIGDHRGNYNHDSWLWVLSSEQQVIELRELVRPEQESD
jgi:hypothetical protein